MHDAISLNRNDLSVPQRVEQIQGYERAAAVIDFYRLGLKRKGNVLGASLVALGRAHDPNGATKSSSKSSRSEIIAAHVGGQNDGTARSP